MIDLTNVKAPGWQRVVAELSAGAPDDRSYLERLLRVVCQATAARQAVLFVANRTDGEDVEPRIEMVWPRPGAGGLGAESASGQAPIAPDVKAIDNARETMEAARGAFGAGQSRVFSLEGKQELYYDAGGGGGGGGTVLAVPLFGAAAAQAQAGGTQAPTGVITLLLEARSKEAVRSTLAMAEVLSGYFYGHQARAALKRTQSASQALDVATRLIASINTAPNFKGAGLQLTNDIAKQIGVDRVALGWVKHDTVKVQAISDTEHFDKRMAMVQKLQSAMDECLDQEQPVVYPPPAAEGPNGDVILAQAIVHAHRELASGNAKLKVASLPLRATDVIPGTAETTEEQVVGVVTIEAGGEGPIDLSSIELLQAALDLVAPVLRIRRNDDRNLAQRACHSSIRAASWAVGPRHTVWKLVSVLVFAAAVFVTFFHMTYRPGAEATLEPRTKRIVSMPFDGIVRSIGANAEPGRTVAQGEVLVELDTTEWRLSMADVVGQIAQADLQAKAAREAKQWGKAAEAQEQVDRLKAQVEFFNYKIAKSKITAPIAGMVMAGDLKERIGSTVKLGEPLLQVADPSDILCIARVDERDIGLIRKAFDERRGVGKIATKGAPAMPLAFTVEGIVPMATAGEGQNVFEVRARIDQSPENADALSTLRLVAGVEGQANFDTERKSLLWIGTRRIVDAVRLWFW
ncbi:MAG: HlyD family efflux transporter periplasmic adaptor subunit [Phycisphaerales bacterium]|nr:HlyD family efflux transporter periplasmic adaptor subunit [Phycisphaerales bacterium]